MKILLSLPLLTLCTFTAVEAGQATNTLDQHEWLKQLVGEWDVSSEMLGEPGGDSTTWESKESIRSIGGLWIVAEDTFDDDGQPFTSIMTLGYDPSRNAFVRSWIDTNQPRLWSSVGQLDKSRRVLRFESEGPSHADPSKTVKYRRVTAPKPSNFRISLNSVLVADQEAALSFYTEVLGFEKKVDLPLGGEYRWLTVVSPEDTEGPRLLLEPNEHPAAAT